MKTEIVLNWLSKYGVDQTYREQFVDEEEDNTGWFDNHCQESFEELKTNPNHYSVPAEASPLTCGRKSRRNGR